MYTRADITLEDRMEIFSHFWRFGEEHGTVSELARQWQTSRHFIYEVAERVRRAVDWQRPGRPAGDRAEAEAEGLQRRVQELAADCDRLRGQLEIARGEGEDRKIGLLLELALCPVSEEKIKRCLGAAFGCRVSVGWINDQLRRAGEAALSLMNRQEVRCALKEAALDEVFSHRHPILTVVEPHTLMALVPEASADRQGATWCRVLEQYPELELAVSDQGSGLLRGVALQGGRVEHQADLFHFKRSLRREVKRLEGRCYEAIEGADRARRLEDSPRLLSSAKVQAVVEYREKAEALDRLLEAFDWLEVIVAYLEEHLEPFDWRRSRLRSWSEAQAVVDEVLELVDGIRNLEVSAVSTLIEEARGSLLTFLARLERRLGQIEVRWRQVEGSRMAVFDAVAKVWQRGQPAGESAAWQRRYLASLCGLSYWKRRVENFEEVAEAVMKALDSVVRASNAVECINSIIRPYVAVKKHLSQGFLALIAFYWNMHPLKQRGWKTPFEASGVWLGSTDWVELLEIEMKRMGRATAVAA